MIMKKFLFLFCLSLLTLSGCEKEFVETAPENLYSAITVYKTLAILGKRAGIPRNGI